jgi:hypothetical protein
MPWRTNGGTVLSTFPERDEWLLGVLEKRDALRELARLNGGGILIEVTLSGCYSAFIRSTDTESWP